MVVIFVSPFLRKDVYLFLDRLSKIPGVLVGLISDLDDEHLPPQLTSSVKAYWRVRNLLDPGELVWAARGLSEQLGPIHRMFTEYELIQMPVAEARAQLGVTGMSPDIMQSFRDKAVMKERLRAAEVPCAQHRCVETREQAFEFSGRFGYPVIIKPLAGVGSRETYQANNDAELSEVLSWNPPSIHNQLQLEEFIEGEEYSLDTITLRGKPLWHSITRYLPSPLEVMRNPWIQWRIITPREVDDPEFDDIRAVGEEALAVLGMETNISHTEWFRRSDGTLAISEIAARPPGSRIFTALNWANDFDMYDAWVRLMTLEEFTPPVERKYAVGTAFLRGMGTGQVLDVHGLDSMLREFGPLLVEVDLPYVGQPKGEAYDGEGYIMVRHRETSVVEHALSEIVKRVRVELG